MIEDALQKTQRIVTKCLEPDSELSGQECFDRLVPVVDNARVVRAQRSRKRAARKV